MLAYLRCWQISICKKNALIWTLILGLPHNWCEKRAPAADSCVCKNHVAIDPRNRKGLPRGSKDSLFNFGEINLYNTIQYKFYLKSEI